MKAAPLLVALLLTRTVYGHGDAPWAVQPLPWTNSQIARVIAAFGKGQAESMEGRPCVIARYLAFDVRDSYAFDLDEEVWVDVDFYDPSPGAAIQLTYDRADVPFGVFGFGKLPGRVSINVATSTPAGFHRETFRLERARFANLGFDRTDFLISTVYEEGVTQPPLAVCGISIRRSNQTPVTISHGQVNVELLDENGRPTPARLGIYDNSGRLPLPAEDALTLQSLVGPGRVVPFPADGDATIPPWPVDNRSVFYANGSYRTQLPPGRYDLIVSKGLEYRMVRRHFTVEANKTSVARIQLQRWHDLAKRGWISGDDHIHYALQSTRDERGLQLLAQAEDVRVANILQFGNVARTYFYIDKDEWRPLINPNDDRFVLVPGQEDPRTDRLGHTISLNLREPVRDPAHYPIYHEVFDKVHSQGGLVGYAHVTDEHLQNIHADRGMAVDVPFGIIDFAEVLSGTASGGAAWFDFLNLGYKLSPTGGTDFIFGSLPGSTRMYVKSDGPFTAQAWFDALEQGRTFVTDGPVLEFNINRNEIGSDIPLRHDDVLTVSANASLNPDFGNLASIELIEQGDVVKQVTGARATSSLNLQYRTIAEHSTWFVVRAKGAREGIVAISAPIYVSIDKQPAWKRSEVPSIVARLKTSMAKMLESEVIEGDNEGWESQKPLAEVWSANEAALKSRVAEASAKLDELAKRAATSVADP